MNNKISYKKILENIDGLVVVDKEGKIIVMEDAVAKTCYVDGVQMSAETAVGMDIFKVIPTTKIMDVFSSGRATIADYYFVEGRMITSSRKPIFNGDEIVAAVEYDLFGVEGEHFTDFWEKTIDLSKKGEALKKIAIPPTNFKYTLNSIIGSSKATYKMKEEIKVASRYTSTILIEGNTGVGKELVAHAIHTLSDRQLMPFIKLNCASMPDNLIESELFGYEEGSFTGASRGGKKGKIEQCNGGTLFLDEINQLPLSVQPKLLRVLQEREINPIGSDKIIPVDIRVIAASNEDLYKMVEAGHFRRDLYYRLNVMKINVPTLAERKDDIYELIMHFIAYFNRQMDKNVSGISQKALYALTEYGWPGNIRELNNVIERAMNYCMGNTLTTKHFRETFMKEEDEEFYISDEGSNQTLEYARNAAERKAIVDALIKCRGNKVKAAQLLNISRSLIHKKIVKLKISEEEYQPV